MCGTAQNGKQANEAVVQQNIKNKNTFVLGRLNDVDVEGTGEKE